MAQNTILGKLKLKIFYESIFPESLPLETLRFLSFMTIQDPFSTPVLSAFRYPWISCIRDVNILANID